MGLAISPKGIWSGQGATLKIAILIRNPRKETVNYHDTFCRILFVPLFWDYCIHCIRLLHPFLGLLSYTKNIAFLRPWFWRQRMMAHRHPRRCHCRHSAAGAFGVSILVDVELSILSWGYPQSPSDDPVGDDWGSHMTAGKPPCITGSRGWFVEDHPRHRNWFLSVGPVHLRKLGQAPELGDDQGYSPPGGTILLPFLWQNVDRLWPWVYNSSIFSHMAFEFFLFNLVGGFKHVFFFHVIYGLSSFPLTMD